LRGCTILPVNPFGDLFAVKVPEHKQTTGKQNGLKGKRKSPIILQEKILVKTYNEKTVLKEI